MSQDPMSTNEAALWDEVAALKARLDATIEGWRQSIEQTGRAMENTDRALEQTEKAIALAKEIQEIATRKIGA